MAESAPETPQVITPYLYYEDVEAALAWLAEAFGFRERAGESFRNDAGRVVHAAVDAGLGGQILMGCPGDDYRSPGRTGHVSQNVYVYVEDVDDHFVRAREAGGRILEEPTDTFYGDRRYGAADPEGHHWYFAQKLRNLSPEAWTPSREDLGGHA